MTSIVDIDLDIDLDRVLGAPDPCAALAQERERGWIAASPFGFHVLAFEPAFDLLRDRRFHPDVVATLDGAGISDPTVRQLWTTALLGSRPSAHDRLRKLVAPYFTRRAVTELRDLVTTLTERLADPLAGAGPVDVVAELTSRIPPAVFTRMIAGPDEDVERIGRWSTTILQIFARDPRCSTEIEAAVHELLAYVDAFVSVRRRTPAGDDMISALLAAEEDGDRLSPEELQAIVLEVLEASTDNTASSLATLLYAAALHPDHWSALRDDPSRIPAFVEEVGRLWPRVVHISRSTATDVEWRDLQLPAGTELLVSVPSALRDPAVFADPSRFDPDREYPNAYNLNYGSGGHHCIGASLARMEMTTALEVLTRKWARLEFADAPRMTANIGVVTMEHLPLRITPA
jgi:cytochrome P450